MTGDVIMLLCTSVEQVKYKDQLAFRCKFQQMPHGRDVIEVIHDSPAVPGTYYNVLLRGLFPPSCNNQPCVSDILQATFRETLTSVSRQTEAGIKLGRMDLVEGEENESQPK